MYNYANEWELLNDVSGLSRGMTYKAAITGLNIGGGKAVIIGDAKSQKTPELMRKFCEFVNGLSGRVRDGGQGYGYCARCYALRYWNLRGKKRGEREFHHELLRTGCICG